nr:MerR family transcriptional regulator [Sporomusa sp. KB1]
MGDVAKLLSITPEAIRYYEDQGIITSTRDERSGYRYYGVWDIHVLIQSRIYRQYGYSLAEAANLINHCKIDDIASILSEKEADIEKAIIWHMNLLKRIRQVQTIITDTKNNLGKFRLEYRPPMYRLETQDGYKLYSSPHKRALTQSWIEKIPFVFPGALFPKSELEQGGTKFSFGLAVDEEYANFLDIKPSEDVVFFPSRLCLYTAFQSHSGIVLSPRHLAPAIDYMHSQGMKLHGDIISKIVMMCKIENKYYNWHQLWLPIDSQPPQASL